MDEQMNSNAPQASSGGCLKTCLVGCGTIFLIFFLICVAFLIWFLLPYDSFTVDQFFTQENTGAIQLKLDPSNENHFRMLKNFCISAINEANKGKSESEKAAVMAKFEDNAEELKTISSLSCNFLVATEDSTDKIMLLAPIPGGPLTKLLQMMYSTFTFVLPSENLVVTDDAKILLLEDPKNKGVKGQELGMLSKKTAME